jgi:signal transduction histidine kinase/ActR/RegA family two-component response regulator
LAIMPPRRPLWLLPSIVLVYFAAAKLGFTMAFVAEQVTVVWAPTGIALTALLLFGPRVWPAITLGAFLANLTTNESVLTAAGIALGNTGEAVAGAWLLGRLKFATDLGRVRDVIALVATAMLSTIVSATIGVTSLVLGGYQPWSRYGSLWSVWWLGDAMGDLIVAPVLMTWSGLRRPFRRAWEAAALVAAAVAVNFLVFAQETAPAAPLYGELQYTVFPVVIWAALRFGPAGTALVTLVSSIISISGTLRGSGPFAVSTTHESLILLEVFMAIVGGTGLLLGSIITERNRAEQQREEFLAREQEARREAEVARLQAQAANRLKDEFLATVSHELRTPLNAVLGWSRLLGDGKLDPDDTARALQTIQRNAVAQAQIVDDLLDVSSIVTGRLRLSMGPVELAPAIEAAVDSVRPAAQAKEIELAVDLERGIGRVDGDPGRLRQVVWNLLTNALKFTPRAGRVELRLERIESEVEITVSDNGQGISATFLPHVFERFRQADGSTKRAHGGLGLGLAIVRHIVELHGGTVEASSPGEGLGAVFRVRLPVRSARADASAPQSSGAGLPAEGPASLDGIRVLVVDDDADTCQMLSLALAAKGAEVKTATVVGQAMEELKHWRPHVLVADIAMPNEDGYVLIQAIRALEDGEAGRIPAIAYTAYTRGEDRMRCLAAGYQMHIPKPADPGELAAAISSLAVAARSDKSSGA